MVAAGVKERALMACSALALGALPMIAQAQAVPAAPPKAAPDDARDDIIVTANRVQERQRDVALSITAITGEDLELRKTRSFEDYAALVPGLSLQSRGAGNTRVTLRGQNVGGSGATVAIYIDDSPIGSSTALVGGAVATADLDSFDLQRVEVLRGPQGTLYGANAEGGLIKFVTNAPDLAKLSAAGEIGGQTVDHGGSGGSARGWVNVPIVEGKLAVRGGAFYEHLPGFIDNPILGLKDVDRGSRYGFRAALLAQPTDELTLKFSALIQKSSLGGQPLEDVVGATDPAQPPANQTSPVLAYNQNRYVREHQSSLVNNYSALVSYELGDFTVSSVTSYGRIVQQVTTDLSGSSLAPGFSYRDFATSGIYGRPSTIILPATNGLKKWTEEARIAGKVGRLDIQGGFFYTNERGALSQRALGIYLPEQTVAPGGVLFGADVNSKYDEYAGYGNLTYHFSDAFDLAAGIRYASNRQRAETVNVASLFGGPASTLTYKSSDDVVTWSVAPRWRLSPSTLLYARVARGYRPGGPNAPPPGAPANFPTSYGSDKTISYEAGVRADVANKAVTFDLAAFHIDWTDIQIAQIFQTQFSYTGNGGTAVSNGIEGTINLRPLRGLDVALNGAYTDAHLTSDAPGTGGFRGDDLPYVPDFSGSVDWQYSWSLSDHLGANLGGTVNYVGQRYTVFTAGGIVSHARLSSYATLALRAGVDFDRFSLQLFGRNLTNTRAVEQYFSDGAPGSHGIATINQPRTVGIALSARY